MLRWTPRPGPWGTWSFPPTILGASSSRSWPSCQIQWVSRGAGSPTAAAPTWAKAAKVMSKWLLEWIPQVSPQLSSSWLMRTAPSKPQKWGSARMMSQAFRLTVW